MRPIRLAKFHLPRFGTSKPKSVQRKQSVIVIMIGNRFYGPPPEVSDLNMERDMHKEPEKGYHWNSLEAASRCAISLHEMFPALPIKVVRAEVWK